MRATPRQRKIFQSRYQNRLRSRVRKTSADARAGTINFARQNTTVAVNSTGNFNGAINPFLPESCRVTLNYHEVFSDVNVAVASPVFKYFRLSNPTDPNFATGGHQPMGYDQLCAIYSKCTVTAAKVKYQIYPADGSDASHHFRVCGRPYTSSDTQPTSVQDEFERGNACCQIVSGYDPIDKPASIYVKNWMKAGKSSPEAYEQDDDYEITNTSTATFAPVDEIRFAIGCDGIGNASTVKTAWVVTITMYCKFFERRLVDPS